MMGLTFAELAPRVATGHVAPLDDNERVLAALASVLDAPSIRARLAAHERDHRYPRDVLDELRAAGLASLFDDARATAHHLAWLNAIAATASASLAITVGVDALAMMPLYLAGSDAQRAHVAETLRRGASLSLLLTEWGRGSDLIRNRASATRDPGGHGFRLVGDKHLINGGAEHELLVCLLRTRATDAAVDASASDFTLFLVERGPAVRTTRRHRTLPCAAADISDVHFDDVPVDDDAVIGGIGEGFSLVRRTLAISRGGIGALASGTATAARRIATAYAGERMLYGRPIGQLGAIALHLARLHALDLAVAALAIKQAAFVDAFGPGAAYLTAVAKVACTTLAEEAVGEGRRILGASALVATDHGYDRLVRDVPLYAVFDGTTHVILDELQWRLAQLAHARSTALDDQPRFFERLAQIYAAPPRPLRAALRTSGRVVVPPIASHLADLARAASPLAEVAVVAGALLDTVSELRRTPRWDADQALRFAAATALTELEAVAAIAELAEPACRAALGLSPLPRATHAITASFAIAWLGARATAAVRALALRTTVDLGALDRAERALHAAVDATLPPLVATLTRSETT